MESAYIAQLNPMEQKILQIARSHLETSFSLTKSIGFQEWQKAQQEQEQKEPKIQQQVQQTQAPEKKLIKRKIKILSKPS